jgi:hypothetical protein
MRQHPGEEGVSEVVGVMLLVGVTVLAVAIVAAVFLSGPQPGEIPHATIVAGNKSGSLVLAHEGGDPLRAGEYRIYIENESGFVDGTSDFAGPEDGVWSIGGNITYNGTETLKRVVVTAVSGGSETILAEPQFVGGGEGAVGFSPDPVEPGTVPNGGDGGSGKVPISIVDPEIGIDMGFTFGSGEYRSPVSARVTNDNVKRVDFLLYGYAPSTNYAIDNQKNATGKNGTYEKTFIVKPGNAEGHMGDTRSVVVVAIAFNDTAVIGCEARMVNITT